MRQVTGRIIACSLLALGATAIAQPGERPRPPGETDSGVMRARIEQQLERVEATETRLRAALEQLDAGASPADVFATMQEEEPGGPVVDRMRERFEAELARIEEIDPEAAVRIRQAGAVGPREAIRAMREERQRLDLPPFEPGGGREAGPRDRERGEPITIRSQLREWRASMPEDPEARAEWRDRVRGEVSRAFDAELRRTERQIEDLEARIEQLSAGLERRRDNRERFIEGLLRRIESGGFESDRGPQERRPERRR